MKSKNVLLPVVFGFCASGFLFGNTMSYALEIPQYIYESAKLLPETGDRLDVFGRSVSTNGRIAVVGAPRADTYAPDSGAAYLFDTATGEFLFDLVPNDLEQSNVGAFGVSVAISDRFAFVGAPFSTTKEFIDGAVYVFDIHTGSQVTKLLSSTPEEYGRFGEAVSVSGSNVIIGATRGRIGDGPGIAYIFDVDTGTQLVELQPQDNVFGAAFGYSVSMSEQYAVVGAPFDDDNGGISGSAYLFDVATGNQIRKLLPSDGDNGDRFGESVGVSDSFVIVGAPVQDEVNGDAGAAYVFDPASGNQLSKLLPHDIGSVHYFGDSVAILDNLAIVGSPQSDGVVNDTGSAYLFDLGTGRELSKFIASDGTDNDSFGASVSISRNNVVIGADADDFFGNASGSAYVFAIPEPSTQSLIALIGVLLFCSARHGNNRLETIVKLAS